MHTNRCINQGSTELGGKLGAMLSALIYSGSKAIIFLATSNPGRPLGNVRQQFDLQL
jgi:hypothetical protein